MSGVSWRNLMNYQEILQQVEAGHIRAAIKEGNSWRANAQVKQAILEAFKAGVLKNYGDFVDKDTIPPRSLTVEDKIRLVPGGSSIRCGAYVAKGTVIMPPSYINIGAYVDEGVMVDSHVLVGSCAQIGKHVHLSAGVQIGGVLEPIGLAPVVIEDNCFLGAGVIVVEGVQVGEGAVLAPGVKLSKSIPVYDCVNERVLKANEPIPKNAVVVPGSRPISKLQWAKNNNLSLHCAIIIKYRDEKTASSLNLETLLR